MKKKWILIAALIGLVLIGAIAAGPIMSDVETPKYQVLETQGNIEIRRYDPMIIAEVQMRGTRKTAVGNGFRLLADYIFGNNVAKRTGPMTAQAQPRKSLKIAMTAPVQQQRANDNWQISFVMPSTYTMATLPEPANERVALKVQNSRLYAAISFSGHFPAIFRPIFWRQKATG